MATHSEYSTFSRLKMNLVVRRISAFQTVSSCLITTACFILINSTFASGRPAATKPVQISLGTPILFKNPGQKKSPVITLRKGGDATKVDIVVKMSEGMAAQLAARASAQIAEHVATAVVANALRRMADRIRAITRESPDAKMERNSLTDTRKPDNFSSVIDQAFRKFQGPVTLDTIVSSAIESIASTFLDPSRSTDSCKQPQPILASNRVYVEDQDQVEKLSPKTETAMSESQDRQNRTEASTRTDELHEEKNRFLDGGTRSLPQKESELDGKSAARSYDDVMGVPHKLLSQNEDKIVNIPEKSVDLRSQLDEMPDTSKPSSVVMNLAASSTKESTHTPINETETLSLKSGDSFYPSPEKTGASRSISGEISGL